MPLRKLNINFSPGVDSIMQSEFDISGLYVLTNHDQQDCDAMLTDMEACLRGGANLIQFRTKVCNSAEKKLRAQKMLDLCRDYQTPLIINDDINLCHEIGAHGVHLGQQDSSIKSARKILGLKTIIGATCHNSIELVQRAQIAGASYVALGSFFASNTKPDATQCSLTRITEVRRHCNLPIVAIGGIKLDNALPLVNLGINAIAVIDDILSAPDIELRASEFSQLFNH